MHVASSLVCLVCIHTPQPSKRSPSPPFPSPPKNICKIYSSSRTILTVRPLHKPCPAIFWRSYAVGAEVSLPQGSTPGFESGIGLDPRQQSRLAGYARALPGSRGPTARAGTTTGAGQPPQGGRPGTQGHGGGRRHLLRQHLHKVVQEKVAALGPSGLQEG
ncbi:unnamed protein product [Discosporangium mesarthrocarpum]